MKEIIQEIMEEDLTGLSTGMAKPKKLSSAKFFLALLSFFSIDIIFHAGYKIRATSQIATPSDATENSHILRSSCRNIISRA
jgi:hypothetical protein